MTIPPNEQETISKYSTHSLTHTHQHTHTVPAFRLRAMHFYFGLSLRLQQQQQAQLLMMLLPVCLVGEKKVLPKRVVGVWVRVCVQLPAAEIFIDLGRAKLWKIYVRYTRTSWSLCRPASLAETPSWNWNWNWNWDWALDTAWGQLTLKRCARVAWDACIYFPLLLSPPLLFFL